MDNTKCICPEHDSYYCIEGVLYGFCEAPTCGGVCEPIGDCDCQVCHEEE